LPICKDISEVKIYTFSLLTHSSESLSSEFSFIFPMERAFEIIRKIEAVNSEDFRRKYSMEFRSVEDADKHIIIMRGYVRQQNSAWIVCQKVLIRYKEYFPGVSLPTDFIIRTSNNAWEKYSLARMRSEDSEDDK